MLSVLVVADEPWVINDVRAALADTRYAGFGIDTPEDLERARAILAAQRS